MSKEANTTNKLIGTVNKQSGGNAMLVVSDTNATAEDNYYGFLTLAATTIAAITYVDPNVVSGTLTGIVIPAGVFVYVSGNIKTLTLTSGSIILYKNN